MSFFSACCCDESESVPSESIPPSESDPSVSESLSSESMQSSSDAPPECTQCRAGTVPTAWTITLTGSACPCISDGDYEAYVVNVLSASPCLGGTDVDFETEACWWESEERAPEITIIDSETTICDVTSGEDAPPMWQILLGPRSPVGPGSGLRIVIILNYKAIESGVCNGYASIKWESEIPFTGNANCAEIFTGAIDIASPPDCFGENACITPCTDYPDFISIAPLWA